MTAMLLTCTSIVAMLAAFGLHRLQLFLERWDHDRHYED